VHSLSVAEAALPKETLLLQKQQLLLLLMQIQMQHLQQMQMLQQHLQLTQTLQRLQQPTLMRLQLLQHEGIVGVGRPARHASIYLMATLCSI
jgi:hypothetical protein